MMILTSAAITVSSAFAALPEVLPEPSGKPISFQIGNVLSAELAIEGQGTVSCALVSGSGEFTSQKLGIFKMVFKACEVFSTKCTGLSDKVQGEITVEGEFHVWRGWLISATKAKVKHPAVLVLLPKHIHFTCGGISLVLVLGCAAALIDVNTLSKFLEVEFYEGEKGSGTERVNDITEVENEKGELIQCSLKGATNEGKEVPGLLRSWLELLFFKQGGKEITILIMG